MQKASFYIARRGGYALHMNVMFNPSSYSLESNVEYSTAADAEKHTDTLQFAKTQARRLSFELYFDSLNGDGGSSAKSAISGSLKDIFASRTEDITQQLEKLRELTEPVKQGVGKYGTPPIVMFSWGSFSFVGVVTSLRENCTMFLRNGRPAKATVTVSMTEYIPPSVPAAPPVNTAASSLLESSGGEDHSEAAKAAVSAAIST